MDKMYERIARNFGENKVKIIKNHPIFQVNYVELIHAVSVFHIFCNNDVGKYKRKLNSGLFYSSLEINQNYSKQVGKKKKKKKFVKKKKIF